jgi:transcriptional regulator with XRE-family HTH domain
MDLDTKEFVQRILEEIQHCRNARNITQKELAAQLGVVKPYYSQIEQGVRPKLSFGRFMEIAIALHVPLYLLILKAEAKPDTDYKIVDNDLSVEDISKVHKYINNYFKEKRDEIGLSKRELADYINLEPISYDSIESNKIKNVGLYRYIELAKLYDIPLHEIIKEAEQHVWNCKIV